MNPSNLKEKKWKSFKIDEIFIIRASLSGIDKNKINQDGEIPYITRSDKKNGVSLFVSKNQKDIYKIEKGNVLTIGLDTNSVCYQPYKFYTGQNIHILTFQKMNKEIGLFLIPLIKEQLQKFSWGSNGATLTRVKRMSIMLPINSINNAPDWEFMENYSKNIYHAKKEKIKIYQSHKMNKIFYKAIESLEEKKWKCFEIDEIFIIENGIRLTKGNRVNGKIPYIGASSLNNGITDFTSSINETLDSNLLGVNYNGSVAESFYHQYKAIFGDDVKKLKLRSYNGDKFIYIFLGLCIKLQKGKFEWGFKMNTQRLKRQKIMLPIDPTTGSPDYIYMRQYIINIEQKISNTIYNY